MAIWGRGGAVCGGGDIKHKWRRCYNREMIHEEEGRSYSGSNAYGIAMRPENGSPHSGL
jgi:hypothetical protein